MRNPLLASTKDLTVDEPKAQLGRDRRHVQRTMEHFVKEFMPHVVERIVAHECGTLFRHPCVGLRGSLFSLMSMCCFSHALSHSPIAHSHTRSKAIGLPFLSVSHFFKKKKNIKQMREVIS